MIPNSRRRNGLRPFVGIITRSATILWMGPADSVPVRFPLRSMPTGPEGTTRGEDFRRKFFLRLEKFFLQHRVPMASRRTHPYRQRSSQRGATPGRRVVFTGPSNGMIGPADSDVIHGTRVSVENGSMTCSFSIQTISMAREFHCGKTIHWVTRGTARMEYVHFSDCALTSRKYGGHDRLCLPPLSMPCDRMASMA